MYSKGLVRKGAGFLGVGSAGRKGEGVEDGGFIVVRGHGGWGCEECGVWQGQGDATDGKPSKGVTVGLRKTGFVSWCGFHDDGLCVSCKSIRYEIGLLQESLKVNVREFVRFFVVLYLSMEVR